MKAPQFKNFKNVKIIFELTSNKKGEKNAKPLNKIAD